MFKKIKDWFTKKQDAPGEALKEVLRMTLFTLVSALVVWGIQELTKLDPANTWAIVGLFVLRWIDKWLHETKGKTGLAPF